MSLPLPRSTLGRSLAAATTAAAVLAACAVIVQRQTRRAEQAHPPRGRFVDVRGVRLHFSVHGRDDATQTVVMLHDGGSLGRDFDVSGLAERASERYRVVVFDRPSHGHSACTPRAGFGLEDQADLLHAALTRLGVVGPIVLGHATGAAVALAMALRHPDAVGSLVLMSGAYFPGLTRTRPLQSMLSWPLVGSLLRHTLAPLLGRLAWPLAVRRLFWPAAPTEAFRARMPAWLALRPAQLQARAADTAAWRRLVRELPQRYGELQVPAVLVAGAHDPGAHAARLHRQLERSWLRIIEGAGRAPHHVAPNQVVAAIDQAAAIVWDRSLRLRPAAGLKAGGAQRAVSANVVPCA